MSHTPGPWRVAYMTTGNIPWRYEIVGGQVSDEEAGDNAQLIEAAPEMLEALKSAEALVLGWCAHYAMKDATTDAEFERATKPENWHPTHKAIYDKVKDAIRKAEEGQ